MSSTVEVVDAFVVALAGEGVWVRRVDRRPGGDRDGCEAFDVITQAGDVVEVLVAPDGGVPGG